MHEIVCENMASAARVHAVERGAVIGEHTLIAFGGAAPLHAARVAEKIGVSRVIVPSNAGVGSAVGFLAAPIAYELVRSRHMRLDAFDAAGASALLDEMATEARALVEPGAGGAPVSERRQAFMRYVGQGHEITVDAAGARSDGGRRRSAAPGLRDGLCGLVRAVDSRRRDRGAELVGAGDHRAAQAVAHRRGAAPAPEPPARAFFDGRAAAVVEIPFYRRDQMAPGVTIAGPAVIAEDDTSTFVSASFDAQIDGAGCIVMERKAA